MIKITKEEVIAPITNFINIYFIKHLSRWTWNCWHCPSPKKQDANDKTNYQAIGLLPIISMEKVLYEQIKTVANERALCRMLFKTYCCGKNA